MLVPDHSDSDEQWLQSGTEYLNLSVEDATKLAEQEATVEVISSKQLHTELMHAEHWWWWCTDSFLGTWEGAHYYVHGHGCGKVFCALASLWDAVYVALECLLFRTVENLMVKIDLCRQLFGPITTAPLTRSDKNVWCSFLYYAYLSSVLWHCLLGDRKGSGLVSSTMKKFAAQIDN